MLQNEHLIVAAGNMKSEKFPIFSHNVSEVSIASPVRAITVDPHYYLLDE